jgi:hypothetical protein
MLQAILCGNKNMKYEIINKENVYKIKYSDKDKEVISSHSFKNEQDAVDFIFSTEHFSTENNGNISITINNGKNKHDETIKYPVLAYRNFSRNDDGVYKYKGHWFEVKGEKINLIK